MLTRVYQNVAIIVVVYSFELKLMGKPHRLRVLLD